MATWVLIFYMSTMTYSNNATGGPATIDGFTSYTACMAAGEAVAKVKKYDWHECVEVRK